MSIGRLLLGLLGLALVVGMAASVFWTGHASSGSPSLESKTYQPGWASVAWLDATMPVEAAVSSIGDSVGSVYYLDPDTGGWQRYIAGRPEVSNLTMMAFGKSYLLLFTKPVTLDLATQPSDICPSSECPPCPTPTQCPSPTPCPDCGDWQSLAENCAIDYGQCVADYGECVGDLTWCLGALDDIPDITEVCSLIHDLSWQYDLAVPILDQYSLHWLSLTMVIEDLESWRILNCW